MALTTTWNNNSPNILGGGGDKNGMALIQLKSTGMYVNRNGVAVIPLKPMYVNRNG